MAAELSRAWKLWGPVKFVDEQVGDKHFSGVQARATSGTNILRGYLAVNEELVLVELSYSEPAVPALILDLVSSMRAARSDEAETEIAYHAAGFRFVAPMSCSFLPDKDRIHRPRLYLASWDGRWMIRFGSPSEAPSAELASSVAAQAAAKDAPGLKKHYDLPALPRFASRQIGKSILYSTKVNKPTFSLDHGFVVAGKRLLPVEVVLNTSPSSLQGADQQTLNVLASLEIADPVPMSRTPEKRTHQ